MKQLYMEEEYLLIKTCIKNITTNWFIHHIKFVLQKKLSIYLRELHTESDNTINQICLANISLWYIWYGHEWILFVYQK